MNFEVTAGDISVRDTDAIVVNLLEGVTRPGGATGAVDSALDGAISRLIGDGEITGKRGEVTVIHTLGKIAPARVVVAGLGKSSDFDAEAVRSISGETARRLQKIGVSRYSTIAHGAGIGGMDAAQSAQAIVEGTVLGLYDFDRFKSSKNGRSRSIRSRSWSSTPRSWRRCSWASVAGCCRPTRSRSAATWSTSRATA